MFELKDARKLGFDEIRLTRVDEFLGFVDKA